ncbi:MAG: type II toxin-antitoxin system YafQ family toxin [Lachnospiraceae bacterium]|nr:type II toxin-antitoxin system YafQ family toxin [Lachnospiraceae bacterium]
MTYNIKPTTQFKKDVKLCKKRGYDMNLLKEVLKLLENSTPLPEKYLDHPLSGIFKNCRECHILPDWLLIYEYSKDDLILYLTRTGTHSDLFKM